MPQAILRNVRAVLFDMDGVLYVGNQPLPGVQALLDYLDRTGRAWLLVTNNASLTPAAFSEKLARMGVHAPPARILGSAEAAAAWLAEQQRHVTKPTGPVLVCGMEGIRAALQGYGFTMTDDYRVASTVVAGVHFDLTYADLANAALAIRNGARFIGTNPDPTFPSERGPIPGAGSILAALEAATSVKPEIIGKPYAPMYELAMSRLGAQHTATLMVGDRYDTDIEGALTLGMMTAAVLTGINTAEEFRAQARPPHLIVQGLPELLAAFQEVD